MTATTKMKKTTTRAWEVGRAGTRTLLDKTGRSLDKAKRTVTQQDAFEAYNDHLEDLSRVVAHLYSQLEELQDVVSRITASQTEGPR